MSGVNDSSVQRSKRGCVRPKGEPEKRGVDVEIQDYHIGKGTLKEWGQEGVGVGWTGR